MTTKLTTCVANRTFPWARTGVLSAVAVLTTAALILRGDPLWAWALPLVLVPVGFAWALGSYSRSPVGDEAWALVVRADEALDVIRGAASRKSGQVDTFVARALYGATASREATVAALVDLQRRGRKGELEAHEVVAHLREHEAQIVVLEELGGSVLELVEARKEVLGRRGRSELAARVASERTGGVLVEARRRLAGHSPTSTHPAPGEVVLDVVGARAVVNTVDIETGEQHDLLAGRRAASSAR